MEGERSPEDDPASASPFEGVEGSGSGAVADEDVLAGSGSGAGAEVLAGGPASADPEASVAIIMM